MISPFIQNTSDHKGKVISHFEDEYGNEIKQIHMNDMVVIVFTDGCKVKLGTDWYGSDCYISQDQ